MSVEARERGPEVAINCSSLLFGVALSYWITFGFTRMANQVSWVGINPVQSLQISFSRLPFIPSAFQ
jgi:hypothetical protein